MSLILLGTILASFCGAVWSSNINIDGTCSIGTGCMQCMSRRSADVERCQQLYFYITYSTGNSLSVRVMELYDLSNQLMISMGSSLEAGTLFNSKLTFLERA